MKRQIGPKGQFSRNLKIGLYVADTAMPACAKMSIFLQFWLHNCFLLFMVPALLEQPSVLEILNSRVCYRSNSTEPLFRAWRLSSCVSPLMPFTTLGGFFFNLTDISMFLMSLWQLGLRKPNVLEYSKGCRMPTISNIIERHQRYIKRKHINWFVVHCNSWI